MWGPGCQPARKTDRRKATEGYPKDPEDGLSWGSDEHTHSSPHPPPHAYTRRRTQKQKQKQTQTQMQTAADADAYAHTTRRCTTPSLPCGWMTSAIKQAIGSASAQGPTSAKKTRRLLPKLGVPLIGGR